MSQCLICEDNYGVHPKYRHASSWTEVQEWLDNELAVADRDQDAVSEVVSVDRDDGIGAVRLVNYEGDFFEYPVESMLLENVPTPVLITPEDEEAAISSIVDAFKASRSID